MNDASPGRLSVARARQHHLAPQRGRQRGVTSIEYALIASLVAMAIVVAVAALGNSAGKPFDAVSSALNKSGGGGGSGGSGGDGSSGGSGGSAGSGGSGGGGPVAGGGGGGPGRGGPGRGGPGGGRGR